MNAADFKRIVLGLAGVVEGAHMGHADFRVGGRIFASLDADEMLGRMKLPPDEQARFVGNDPATFTPASGAWGLQGWTGVQLHSASEEDVGEALTIASQLMAARGPMKKRATKGGRPGKDGPQARTKPARRAAARPASSRAQARSPIDAYISETPRGVQPILRKIRAIVREEVPDAEEKISYRMPAFFFGGALIYFAAFEHHIGIFPPVKGDARLDKALARYRGEKGNLRFPLDEEMPYALIRRVVQARLKDQRVRLAARKRR